jgi:hypothetical protein
VGGPQRLTGGTDHTGPDAVLDTPRHAHPNSGPDACAHANPGSARADRGSGPTASAANWLDGSGVDTSVSYYSDCTGQTPLTQTSAAIDTCVPSELGTDDLYFVGHNYGVFTLLLNAPDGTVMTYYDGSGVAHTFILEGYVDVPRADGAPEPPAGTVAQFQTCLDALGDTIRVFWADAG